MNIETYMSLYTSIETLSSKINIQKGKDKRLCLLCAILMPIIGAGETGSGLVLFWYYYEVSSLIENYVTVLN